MRMTRNAYAKEVWRAIEAIRQGEDEISCPHEDCGQQLRVLVASVRTGTTVVCPEHGIIYRE